MSPQHQKRQSSTAVAATGIAAKSVGAGLRRGTEVEKEMRAHAEPGSRWLEADVPKVAFYQIKKGDTISEVAKRYRLSVDEVTEANPGLEPRKLRVNQSIKLPNIRKGFHIVSRGDNPSTIAKDYGLELKELLRANPEIEPRDLRIGQALALPIREIQKPLVLRPELAPEVAPAPFAQLQKLEAPPPAGTKTSPAPEKTPKFLASILRTFGYEGGVSRDPNDSAHKTGVPLTNLGITGVAMKDYLKKTDGVVPSNAEITQRIENITTDEALRIYASGYWRRDFQPLGSRLSFLMFDWGVNSHPTTAIKKFQTYLGLPKTGKIDQGILKAVRTLGEIESCERFTTCRKKFYQGLVEQSPSKSKYLKNWLERSDDALRYSKSEKFSALVKLFEGTAPRGADIMDPVREGMITLRKGLREPALIRITQERLSKAGWTLAIDSKFGPEMERVVGDFKAHFGLPDNATFGSLELRTLDAILESNKQELTKGEHR